MLKITRNDQDTNFNLRDYLILVERYCPNDQSYSNVRMVDACMKLDIPMTSSVNEIISAMINKVADKFIKEYISDEKAKYELKAIISEILHLEPILLSEQPDIGMTIIEKFEYYARDCVCAFAIFTPDDIAENEGNQYFQARPNVIFELGWFYSNIGRSRTCILMKNDKNMGIFSDLQGVIQKRFYESVKEISREIEIEIKAMGII